MSDEIPDDEDFSAAVDAFVDELLAPEHPDVPHGVSNWQEIADTHAAIDAEPRELVLPPCVWEAARAALGLDRDGRRRGRLLTDAEVAERIEWQAMGLEWFPDDDPPAAGT